MHQWLKIKHWIFLQILPETLSNARYVGSATEWPKHTRSLRRFEYCFKNVLELIWFEIIRLRNVQCLLKLRRTCFQCFVLSGTWFATRSSNANVVWGFDSDESKKEPPGKLNFKDKFWKLKSSKVKSSRNKVLKRMTRFFGFVKKIWKLNWRVFEKN